MSTLDSGTVVDRKYEVVCPLGAGAMANVYEATHRLTGREVALKVMNAQYLRSPDAARRFLREVRLATELRHPNVVEVIDAGQDPESELLYIAMERLRGEDLADRLVFKPPLKEALGWLLEMLPVLAMAHERGVVHRDLKPENTYLSRNEDGSETVKLLDFGIARSLGGTNLTQTGMTLGTPIYMSPEQALRPQEVDHRADLWAFGIMLYEVVAGRPPFDDESPHALVLRAAAEPHLPLHEAAPGIPMRLSKLVDRCLEKTPEARVASATEIETELAAILASGELDSALPIPSRPPPHTKTAAFSLAQDALKRFSDAPPRPVDPAKTPTPGAVFDSAQTLALDPEALGQDPSASHLDQEEEPPKRRAPVMVLGIMLIGAAAGIGGALYADRTPLETPSAATPPGASTDGSATADPEVPTEGVDPPSEVVPGSDAMDALEFALDQPEEENAAPSALGDDPTQPADVEQTVDVELTASGPDATGPVRARPNPRGRLTPRPSTGDTEPELSEPIVAPIVALEPVDPPEPVAAPEPAPSADPPPRDVAAQPSEPSRPTTTTTRPAPRPPRPPRPTPAPAPDPSPPPFSFK
ncbi:MAG: protein kinase [Sandaracinaceae bacterium]